MAYEMRWHTEGKILFQRLYDNVTLEDLDQLTEETNEWLLDIPGTVHVLVDMRDITHYPRSISQMRTVFNARSKQKLGWLVMVTNNKVVLFLAAALTQTFVAHMRYRAFSDLESASTFLLNKVQSEQPTLRIREANGHSA